MVKSDMAAGTTSATRDASNNDSAQGSPTAITAASQPIPGRPSSMLEIQEAAEASAANEDDDIVYPTGTKLGLTIASMMLSCVAYGVDLTIIAAAVPAVTNDFHSIRDIGWYSAVYGLVGSSLTFFWSRCYTLFRIKTVYMSSIVIFEAGALLAAVAPTSASFILGRAVSGCGGTGMSTGTFLTLTHSFPNHKRPMWNGIVAMVQTAAMVSSPLIGGALIDSLSWRWCFYINLPLGAIALIMIFFGFRSPITNTDESLPLKQKLKKLDLPGTMVFVPAIACLLLALQWGGLTYGWGNARIVGLLVVFAVLILVFGYWQFRLQDNAMLPPRLLKNRNLLAGAFFGACCDGVLALTEIYIAIYFQGVRGFTALTSGYLGISMIIGLSVSILLAGFGTSWVGYYNPFMILTSIVTPIASGLLTTLDLESDLPKVLALLGLIGAAIGFGITAPHAAVSTVLAIKDVPMGMGIVGFIGRLLPAILVSSSATLFQNRLSAEVAHSAPGQNITTVKTAGLSDLRNVIGQDRLRDVLLGYDAAVSQTLYLPLALASVSIVGAASMQWISVKKKSD